MAGLISEPETSVEPEEVAELVYVRGDDGSYRGWKTELLAEQITDKTAAKFLLCSYCSGVLRDACSFEKDGIYQLACSLCIPKETSKQISHIHRQTINEKQVNCPLRAKGCGWTKELSEVLHHLEECELFPVACPLGCRDERGEVSRVERRGVETHRTCCPMRTVKCEYCGSNVKSWEMNKHLEGCEEFPIPCPNKCRQDFRVKRKNESNHLREKCPLQPTECPYSQYGCEVRVERRHLDLHENEEIHTHLKLALKKTQDKVATLEREKEDIHTNLKLTMAKVTKLEKEKEDIRTIQVAQKDSKLSIENMQNKITKLEKENDVLRTLVYSRGSLEWKISGVKTKISQNVPTNSDPFYVGLYKFQGEIQWNRPVNYIGLFLRIMKGEWDDTLKWPLRYKYPIVLINQLDGIDNYVRNYEITEEDLEEFPHYLGKPSTERNEGLGRSNFISHADLLEEKYSKDDSITLKISVEQIPPPLYSKQTI